MRNDPAIWKFGSVIAAVRLLALWFMVVAASNPAGWSQATGFYLGYLMLPELAVLHVVRGDAPRWIAGLAVLSFITSYLWAWLLLRLFDHRRLRNSHRADLADRRANRHRPAA